MAKFMDMLPDLAEGTVARRLDQELSNVVEAVANTTKDGTLTLTLGVKWENGMAVVYPEIKAKIPQHGLPAALFFFGEKGKGELHREDPRQLSLLDVEEAKRPTVNLPVADRPLRAIPITAANGAANPDKEPPSGF